jgi:hypothetical protein
MLKFDVLGISQRTAVLFFLALAFAPGAKAGITETEISPDAVCKFDEIKSLLGDESYRSGNGFGLSYYKDDTIKAQTRSTIADGVPLNVQPALLEQVRLLSRNVNEKTVLISYSGKREDKNRKFCGWIPWNALVVSKAKPDGTGKSFTDRSFVEAKDAWAEDSNGWSPRFYTVGEMDPAAKDNKLYAKALIQTINSDAKVKDIETFEAQGQNGQEYVVKIYDKPGGKVIGGQKMFNVFDIIDTETRGAEEFLLLAGTRDRVIGWITKDDQLLWPSRMAVHWAGKGKGVIHHNRNGLNTGQAPFAKEPANVLDLLPKNRNVVRFPVLGPRTKTGDSLPDYYEIAFIGRNAGSEDKQKVIDAMASADNIDILFVIDATESMEFLFKDVAKAAGEFASKIEGQRIQIGVMVYGDYLNKGRNGEIQLETAVQLGRLHPDQGVWQALIHRKTFSDEQHDKPEAVFAAVIQAAEKAKWRPDAKFRMIIHIGDAGNREEGLQSAEVLDHPTESSVASALAAKSITYFPIAVKGAYDQAVNAAFVRQVREITELSNRKQGKLGGRFDASQITYDTSSGYETGDRVAHIVAVLDDIHNFYQNLIQGTQNDILCAQTSKADQAECKHQSNADNGTSGKWLAEFVKEARDRLGLDQATIDRIYSRPEVSISGYAPTKVDGVDVFNNWVALDPESFASLQGVMDILCPKIVKTANEHAIQEAMSEMVRGGGGDQMQPGETFQKFFERVLYIPALRLNSEFMKHTPATLARSLTEGTPEAAQEEQQKVCLFSKRLDEMRNDKQILKQRWDADKVLYQTTEEIKFTWLVKSEFGLSIYYIPLDYFP